MAKVDSDAEMNQMLWKVKNGELSSEESDSELDQSFDSAKASKKRDKKQKKKKDKKHDKTEKKDKKKKSKKSKREETDESDHEASQVQKRQKVSQYPSINEIPAKNQWTGQQFSAKFHELLKKRKQLPVW